MCYWCLFCMMPASSLPATFPFTAAVKPLSWTTVTVVTWCLLACELVFTCMVCAFVIKCYRLREEETVLQNYVIIRCKSLRYSYCWSAEFLCTYWHWYVFCIVHFIILFPESFDIRNFSGSSENHILDNINYLLTCCNTGHSISVSSY